MSSNTVKSEISYNNVTVVTTDNQINVTQPVTSVVEIITQGPQGPQGLPGTSGLFTFIGNDTYSTTSSLEVTGSLTVSGSSTFTNIGLAIFSGSVLISGSLTLPEGSLIYGTIVNALTASYINPLNQILFITGGLNILNTTSENPSLIITSGSNPETSIPVFTVAGSGITVLGTLTHTPDSTAGGIYFNGSDFFLGF